MAAGSSGDALLSQMYTRILYYSGAINPAYTSGTSIDAINALNAYMTANPGTSYSQAQQAMLQNSMQVAAAVGANPSSQWNLTTNSNGTAGLQQINSATGQWDGQSLAQYYSAAQGATQGTLTSAQVQAQIAGGQATTIAGGDLSASGGASNFANTLYDVGGQIYSVGTNGVVQAAAGTTGVNDITSSILAANPTGSFAAQNAVSSYIQPVTGTSSTTTGTTGTTSGTAPTASGLTTYTFNPGAYTGNSGLGTVSTTNLDYAKQLALVTSQAATQAAAIQGQQAINTAQGQANVYTANAQIDQQNALNLAQAGTLSLQQASTQANANVGQARATYSGQGFETSGSAVDVLNSATQQGYLNLKSVQTNTNNQVQAQTQQANLANYTASVLTQSGQEQATNLGLLAQIQTHSYLL